MKHKIVYLACDDSQVLKNRSTEILDNFLGKDNYSFEETSHFLFIASGGSEQHALKLSQELDNFILLCHRENNSFAAAMEIAAYLRDSGKNVALINIAATGALQDFKMLTQVVKAVESLKGQRAALLGEVSEWLIISAIEASLIKSKLGVDLLHIPWQSVDSYQDKVVSQAFLNHFPRHDQQKLQHTARVYSLLEEIINTHKLNALSVECFSIVKKDQVTACLPLAVLNSEKTVAACEGDICSMIGKMLIKSITDSTPWQANIAEIENDTILFAHCTAPLNMLESFEVTTHFETGVGTAIQGKISNQQLAAFRINHKLEKFMLIQGELVDAPQRSFACRTQITLKTTAKDAKLLKNKSLGNHHLILPAKYIPVLEHLMEFLQIEKIQ
ncbi:MAG: hypothetical protein KJ578_02255 [Bacteroidetes bacterium]|nr:hypothetical protein [Bacteroidota bacterium]